MCADVNDLGLLGDDQRLGLIVDSFLDDSELLPHSPQIIDQVQVLRLQIKWLINSHDPSVNAL